MQSADKSFFCDYQAHVGSRPETFFKTGLFESEALLIGLNCYEAGQSMYKHPHEIQHRAYLVLEGRGQMRVGAETQRVEAGRVIWVPAGNEHEIINDGENTLVLLVAVAPAHAH